MKISTAFPSNYLRCADLQDRNVRVLMDRVEMEEIGGEAKPVLYFQDKEKGIVLNKTNSNNIAAAYGDDTDDWSGHEIILYPAMTDFQGKTVPCIRVRAPTAKDRVKPALKVANAPVPQSENPADPDDEIPF
jgi:arabinogalactan endo-1,4-beta-galactosidase